MSKDVPTPTIDWSEYRQIVVLTGAGVSAASGLPTYRGVGGVWDTADVEVHATAAALERDPIRVWEFFAQLRSNVSLAKPNAAHTALAEFESRLLSHQRLTLLTQNVDGLHVAAGSRRVVELHGSLHRSRCTGCAFARSEQTGPSTSSHFECPGCGAPMRPDVVLFGETLPVDAEWEAKKALRDCDLFMAIGTSGTVSPAASFVRSAEYAGARTIYVNLEPMSPHNPAFKEVCLGRAEEVLARLLGVPAF
jgi:NAD-dependent deacetylase